MAATKIQTVASSATFSNGSTLTFPANVVVGSTITVMILSQYAVCLPTLTDNLGNAYTRVVNGTNPTGVAQYLTAFVAPVTVGGACTILVTMQCSSVPVMFASEMAGLAVNPYEAHSALNNATSPMSSGSVTSTVNGSYLMSIFSDAVGVGTITKGSAWTDQGAFAGGRRCQDVIQATAGAISADATSATPGNINGYVVVFKAAAAMASLIVTTQPTTTASGNPISPSVVVKATSDGSTVVTSETGPCTSAISAGGVLYGTPTVNFVAGVATFSALVPGGTGGTYTLNVTRSGYTAVTSIPFIVTSGSGGSTSCFRDFMQYDMRALGGSSLTIPVHLRNTDGTPATGKTFSTVSCSLSIDGKLPVLQTLVAGTLGTYGSLGFVEESVTLGQGAYAFCPATLPATGKIAQWVFYGTGLAPTVLSVTLLDGDDGRAPAGTSSGGAIVLPAVTRVNN